MAYIFLVIAVAVAVFVSIGKHSPAQTPEDTETAAVVAVAPTTEIEPPETEEHVPETEADTEGVTESEVTEEITETQGVHVDAAVVTKAPPETTVIATESTSPPAEVKADPDEWIYFKLTAYCPCVKCSGKWGSMTSTGVTAKQGTTIAVNPRQIPYGSTVEIDGYGTYIAQDCGVGTNQIDIYFNNHQDTVNFGVRHAYVRWH